MKPFKRRKEYVGLKCEFCNTNFEVAPNLYRSRLKRNKNYFCSKECSQKYRIGKPNNINYTEDLLFKIKKAQQNKFYSEEAKQKMRESGKKSKTLFKKGHNIHKIHPELKNKILTTQKKETHWNWKGGVTKELLALRGTQKYIDWRNQVFERDSYTCIKCNKTNCYLHAHHKIPFSQIYYEKLEKLMWDISNGVTLCKDCHYLEHKGVKKYVKTV